jgi:hypothetical protein
VAEENEPADASRNDPFVLLEPKTPALGTMAAFARQSRIEEIAGYERSQTRRIWRIRGVVSDHVPLTGDPSGVVKRPSFSQVFVENGPLSLYLHSGGRNAVYFDLVGGYNDRLDHIELRVECKFPSMAFILVLRPLNAFLDVFATHYAQPLCLQRLELVSPLDGEVLVYQMLLPAAKGIMFGHLGGFMQAVPFAPYDAIYREALISQSPFYRLLCAARMYEGTNSIRKWLKEQCAQRKIDAKLPADPRIEKEDLLRFGFAEEFTVGIRTAQDLFHRLKDMRNAIAHFLIERDGADIHVYLADGPQLHQYSISAAALLHYAHLTLSELRHFYTSKIGGIAMGSILPTVEIKDRFIVRASDFGLE